MTQFFPIVYHSPLEAISSSPTSISDVTLWVHRVTPTDVAIEDQPTGVIYEIIRSDVSHEASYSITTAEPDPSARGRHIPAVADHSEYLLKDLSGVPLNGLIRFSPGQASVRIEIEALHDHDAETPQQLQLLIDQGPYTSVVYQDPLTAYFVDAEAGIAEHSRLFFGLFEPAAGASTSAHGYVTLRLSGDNTYGLLTVQFSGLNGHQTGTHLYLGDPNNGPIAFSLPPGQVENEKWTVTAVNPISTDQEMLDALFKNQMTLAVHSNRFPAGEIQTTLVEVTNQAMVASRPISHPTPEYEVLTGEALQQDIYRFLSQATFGPTPEMVADLETRIAANGGDRIAAYDAWITEQMALDWPSHLDYYTASRLAYVDGAEPVQHIYAIQRSESSYHALVGGWLTAATYADAQLRERVAFALSEIMVVGLNSDEQAMLISYNDMLKRHAFGNYSDLLYDVATHPIMGIWLTSFQNQKLRVDDQGQIIASPDENLAREIMQLFSIGLVELNQDGTEKLGPDGQPLETYTQQDIMELARILTGWGVGVTAVDPDANRLVEPSVVPNTDFYAEYAPSGEYIFVPDQWTPMAQFPAYHDTEAKELLGVEFPAGRGGEEELADVVDLLSNHPNTAPFIAYRMIQRMTTSNPSPGYVYRVATAFTDSGNDLGELVRAILLDPEVRNLTPADSVGAGKVREPLVQVVALCRLMHCTSSIADQVPLSGLTAYGFSNAQVDAYEADAARIFLHYQKLTGTNSIHQAAFFSPSVFNWFSPDYHPLGPMTDAGQSGPELQHIDESTIVNYFNLLIAILFDPNDLGSERPIFNGDRARLRVSPPPPMIDAYMAVMDTDGNGLLEPADAAFFNPNKVREASAAVLDIADDYLCGGWLQAEATGDPATDPREIILDGIVNTHTHLDHNTGLNAEAAVDHRIHEAMLFTMMAPQCAVQR